MTFGRDILVVDDVPANLLAFDAALESLGRRVIGVRSGIEALAQLLEQDFAVVLLDVQMPEMDGFETARLIRSRQRTRSLPIIFVTAYSHDDQEVRRAYQLGAIDFLFKPLDAEVLRAKTRVFVDLADAQRRENERLLGEQRIRLEAEALQAQIAAEHAANEALRHANDELARADHHKNEFLAILGHELRNPLAPMQSALDLISREPGKPIGSRVLDIMARQLGHMKRLVDDLFDLSRIGSGKLELRREAICIADVVDDALVLTRPGIEAKRHALSVVGSDDELVVDGDRTRLVQALGNLLVNAARYTPPGGRIDVAWGRRDDRAFVRVADNGVGIDPAMLDRVFEMFVQEGESHSHGGLGLGLALARQLAEIHGGTLRATSEGKGRGSTFELILPLAIGRDMAVRAHETAEMAKPMRVLVIDDDQDVREMTAELLSSYGHDVVTASDGPSGLETLARARPDVAFVDLRLPGLDGYAIAREIREHHPELATRLVAMSGFGQSEDRARSKDAGFDLYLVKPATTTALLDALRPELR
jgi:signal transduction histidine kinase